jgi:hypothetical protein
MSVVRPVCVSLELRYWPSGSDDSPSTRYDIYDIPDVVGAEVWRWGLNGQQGSRPKEGSPSYRNPFKG